MPCTESHCLSVTHNNKKLDLALTSLDSNHAQAQASDICRALDGDCFSLNYKHTSPSYTSKLFKKLAFNDFTQKECFLWEGSFTNKTPCIYVFGKRKYIKNLILKYLDIPKDNLTTKSTCSCNQCINPYHFTYVSGKNAKLSCGDNKLLLAYRSQGAPVRQIAEVLKVHRSTIYRQLTNERFFTGASSNEPISRGRRHSERPSREPTF